MEERIRTFSDDEFTEYALPLINEGLTVPLRVSGGSMNPFLSGGRDTVYISKPAFPLKKGDIAFFRRQSGKVVMHRVCRAKDGQYYFCGDVQTAIEGPVGEERIFGVVNKVNRKGREEKRGCPAWDFFERVWIRIIPLRPILMRIYAFFKGKRKT